MFFKFYNTNIKMTIFKLGDGQVFIQGPIEYFYRLSIDNQYVLALRYKL